jgi:hypothetical protein
MTDPKSQPEVDQELYCGTPVERLDYQDCRPDFDRGDTGVCPNPPDFVKERIAKARSQRR